MRFHFLRASVLALVIIVLGIAPTFHVVHGQSTSCISGLSTDDCQLLTDAFNATTSTLNSAQFSFQATGKAAGVPTPGMENVDLSAKADGAVDLANFLLQANLDYDLKGIAKPQSDKLELRIVDDYGYYKSDLMTQGKWIKSSSKVPAEQKSMFKLSTLSTMLASLKPEDSAMLNELISIPGFIKGTVEDSTTVAGNPSRLFTFDVDLASFFKAPAGQKVIVTYLKTTASIASQLSSTAPTPGTDADYQQQVNALLVVVAPVLNNTKIQLVIEIDPASKLFQGAAIAASTKVDAALVSTFTKTNTTTDFTAEGSANLVLSNLNEAVTVDPVPDATTQK